MTDVFPHYYEKIKIDSYDFLPIEKDNVIIMFA